MSFLENPRFPDHVAFLADGGAGYNTTIVTLTSGFEQRNVNWAQSRGKWDIAGGLLQLQANGPLDATGWGKQQVMQAIQFFNLVKGRAYGFRFKDFRDYQDDTLGTFAFVQSSPTILFQMQKSYAIGSGLSATVRKITKPAPYIPALLAPVFTMSRLGVLLTAGSGVNQYTLDPTTGLVLMGAGSDTTASNFTWTGEFDTPVRFDTDEMRGHMDLGSGFYEWNPIPIVEIRI